MVEEGGLFIKKTVGVGLMPVSVNYIFTCKDDSSTKFSNSNSIRQRDEALLFKKWSSCHEGHILHYWIST